jgi:protein-L-isoaspartate(D-aspartate) O-methyltransferase
MSRARVAVRGELWHIWTDANDTDMWVMTDFSERRVMMVDTQVRPSDVTKFPIIDAMLTVPREIYVPADKREAAYVGENVAIAPQRVVLEPRTLAKLLDALDIQPDELVLDLGCGLGYSTAVIARLAEAVIAVEEDAALAAEAQRTLSAESVDNAAVIAGPLAEGDARHGPYDVVILQGAAEVVPPALLDQVKEGGRVGCLFMEGALGVARIGYKIDGTVTWRFAFNAAAPVLPGFEARRGFVL